MRTKARTKPRLTTICLPAHDRDVVKAIADERGMKVMHAPGLMAEGWKLLTDEQAAAAAERFRRKLATA